MTTTADRTLQTVLQDSNQNEMAAAFRKVKLGNFFAVAKVVVTALGATAAPVITGSAVRAAATITGLDRATADNLPAIRAVVSLRVTASGTAGSLGTYGISDTSGTPIVPPGGAGAAMGIATLSDDGTTLTFPNTVTAFVLQYIPRSETLLSTVWASGV
jgi:hypothetical protein